MKRKLFFIVLIIFILEVISFSFYRLNVLYISHVPKIYLNIGYVPNYNWWTEDKIWGAWHIINSKTIQKKKCYNVIYESNEIGARDKNFLYNKENDIILLGDSFAEGYGVNYLDTSQKIIEDLTDFNVLNFGVSLNTGPVQYYLIYENLAKKYKHNKIIIYFLPSNDFTDNDYNYWKDSKRYRPYYRLNKDETYDFFIPDYSIKNYSSSNKKLKNLFSDYFWLSNIFININYFYKLYFHNNNNVSHSYFFSSSIDQQKAAIYFVEKIINSTKSKIFLVGIPTLNDYKIIESNNIDINKVYWINYFNKLSNSNKNFTFINLLNYKPSNFEEMYLSCDGHWSISGNRWVAKIISNYLKTH